MLKSLVGRTQVLRWSPAFVLGHIPGGCASCFAHGRCTGPQGRARVLYLWRSNRMFCSSCGAMLSLLLWYRSTPSLHASLLDCEFACSGLPLLGAQSSTVPCLLLFPVGQWRRLPLRLSAFRPLLCCISAIRPLAISSGEGLLVLRLCATSSPPEGFRSSR